MTLKGRIAELILKVIRFYFTGRKVHWMSRLDGQPLHRATGTVVSARIDRDGKKNPVGMTFFWSIPGRPIYEMKRFSFAALQRDKTMGWVFFDS